MTRILLTALLLITAPSFELAAPTGPGPVGTTTWWVTDEARVETLAPGGAQRQVEVHAWYPAASADGARAPYLRDSLLEVQDLARRLGGSPSALDTLADVETHARMNAPLSARPASFPLLVFSHGYAGPPSAYAALLEDLASHGYVVLSIVHPYESTAATLADGRVVSMLDDSGAPRRGFLDVVGEWSQEDEVLANVTRTSDEEQQRRLLRNYLSGLPNTTMALHRWVADTKLVVDRMGREPATSLPGRLAARVDLRRLGAFGHSMGGVTAGQFCLEDRRCVAGLNLDGSPQSGTLIDQRLGRPFLMVYSARPGRTGASDAIYRRSASPYFRIDVRQTLHLDFSDMILWGGPLKERNALGTIAPARAVDITRTVVREYFDQVMLGRRSALLAGTQTMPEVTVRR